ncbi:unnamed protein product [Linum tenue]|uniref:Uncharacterized protein n=1 Tax=Linum tenue TaxID=586396 RepID=A0AAV0IDS7_9ROSI|nr:unnamed protein product [Linum tenue]
MSVLKPQIQGEGLRNLRGDDELELPPPLNPPLPPYLRRANTRQVPATSISFMQQHRIRSSRRGRGEKAASDGRRGESGHIGGGRVARADEEACHDATMWYRAAK